MRISLIERAVALAAVVVLGMTGLVAASAPAQAASCVSYSCAGKDPEAYGCSADAVDVRYNTEIAGRYVWHERYSKKCKASWVRMSGVASSDLWGWQAGRIQSRYIPVGETSYYYSAYSKKKDSGKVTWTRMVPRPPGESRGVRFCWDIRPEKADSVSWTCSSWK